MGTSRNELIELLSNQPNDPSLSQRIVELEAEQPADLNRDADALEGVWELRWSSSNQPWLKQSPWLNNLQILDPVNGRGCNLLTLGGPLGSLGGISVEAALNILNSTRIEVTFHRGGWVGPRLRGVQGLQLMRNVKQSFPAWLDITVVDDQLRICRGNAGTTFALLRRHDKQLADYISAPSSSTEAQHQDDN